MRCFRMSNCGSQGPGLRPGSGLLTAMVLRMPWLGFTDPLFEYRLACQDPDRRTPALTLYVSNAHALTCFGGVCYVLVH